MNFDQANKILIDFLDNNIFLNLDVEYAIVKNDIDLLELADIKVEKSCLAGHIFDDNLVFFLTDKIKNEDELLKITKHEIFGHVLINKLSKELKDGLIKDLSKEFGKSFSPFDNEIKRINKTTSYRNISLEQKAEEIFAFVAQNIKIDLNHEFTPFEPKLDGSTKEKIENIIQNLAAGIRENKLSLQKENIIQKSQDKGMSR